MAANEAAHIRPARQNFGLYNDGFAWAFELRLAALGDLTGATITAAFAPTASSADGPTALTITSTPEGLLDSRFSLGYSAPVQGRYDIEIVIGGAGRTYVYGDIRVMENYA